MWVMVITFFIVVSGGSNIEVGKLRLDGFANQTECMVHRLYPIEVDPRYSYSAECKPVASPIPGLPQLR